VGLAASRLVLVKARDPGGRRFVSSNIPRPAADGITQRGWLDKKIRIVSISGMRIGAVLLLSLLTAALVARADEVLPTIKVGAEVYTNVTVTTVTATEIWFSSDKGLVNAKLKDLDPALQKHFNYDAAKSTAAEKQQNAIPPALENQTIDRANAQSVMDAAIARVKAIVNQPVRQFPQTEDMDVAVYSPGWFHPGAEKPEFKTVDVRTTRQNTYDGHRYVRSDLNPGMVFIGPELEFNGSTKYFYTDRTLPKKKLTEAEMLEINRLYRIIGTCEDKLNQSPATGPVAATAAAAAASSGTAPSPVESFMQKYGIVVVAAGVGLLLLAIRVFAGKRVE
jgi:hypothetical protein